jgi:hypothetical protein
MLLFVPAAVYTAASEERYIGSAMKFVLQEHHLRGRKVTGSYRLIRFRKSGENNWLLEKAARL